MRMPYKTIVLVLVALSVIPRFSNACVITPRWEGNFASIAQGWTYIRGLENPNPIEVSGVGSNAWPATQFEQLLDKADTVFLATSRIESLEYVSTKYSDLTLSRALIIPTETLKGEAHSAYEYTTKRGDLQLVVDFERSKQNWRAIKPFFTANIQAQIERHNSDFWFWDSMVYDASSITPPYSLTSCPSGKISALAEDTTYLVIISGQSPTLIEPVSGPLDPLVMASRKRLSSPTNRASKEISFKDFASKFDEAAIIRLDECPTDILSTPDDPYYKIERRYQHEIR